MSDGGANLRRPAAVFFLAGGIGLCLGLTAVTAPRDPGILAGSPLSGGERGLSAGLAGEVSGCEN